MPGGRGGEGGTALFSETEGVGVIPAFVAIVALVFVVSLALSSEEGKGVSLFFPRICWMRFPACMHAKKWLRHRQKKMVDFFFSVCTTHLVRQIRVWLMPCGGGWVVHGGVFRATARILKPNLNDGSTLEHHVFNVGSFMFYVRFKHYQRYAKATPRLNYRLKVRVRELESYATSRHVTFHQVAPHRVASSQLHLDFRGITRRYSVDVTLTSKIPCRDVT